MGFGAGFLDDLRHGDGIDRDGLLDQSVEELAAMAGCTTIEAESVFVQVVVKIPRVDRPVHRTLQPPLQQSRHTVALRQQVLTDAGT